MSELFNYLNSPHLVANFQKVFGIESHFDASFSSSPSSRSTNNNATSTTKPSAKHRPDETVLKRSTVTSHEEASQSGHRRNGSNPATKQLNTDHTHIVANTTIHSQFWYYLFCLGAAMGNEVFYCLFFPFWFWNVDGAIARKVGFLWGIFMYVGQATKDLMCMPRPASPPVVKLEERYVAEYGFPSTHAMVSHINQSKL
jgi:sphingosine-1-phosphate phosphatase 1